MYNPHRTYNDRAYNFTSRSSGMSPLGLIRYREKVHNNNIDIAFLFIGMHAGGKLAAYDSVLSLFIILALNGFRYSGLSTPPHGSLRDYSATLPALLHRSLVIFLRCVNSTSYSRSILFLAITTFRSLSVISPSYVSQLRVCSHLTAILTCAPPFCALCSTFG